MTSESAWVRLISTWMDMCFSMQNDSSLVLKTKVFERQIYSSGSMNMCSSLHRCDRVRGIETSRLRSATSRHSDSSSEQPPGFVPESFYSLAPEQGLKSYTPSCLPLHLVYLPALSLCYFEHLFASAARFQARSGQVKAWREGAIRAWCRDEAT